MKYVCLLGCLSFVLMVAACGGVVVDEPIDVLGELEIQGKWTIIRSQQAAGPDTNLFNAHIKARPKGGISGHIVAHGIPSSSDSGVVDLNLHVTGGEVDCHAEIVSLEATDTTGGLYSLITYVDPHTTGGVPEPDDCLIWLIDDSGVTETLDIPASTFDLAPVCGG